jgi:hypothetical protein
LSSYSHSDYRKYLSSLIAATVLLLGMFFAVPTHAQVAGGTLSGTITDPSGGQVPLAQVVIKNVATGVDRTVTTNTNGYYIAVNLLPGEYLVTISATGFNTTAKSGITINVGSQLTIDVVLQIGTVTHTVEVSTDAPSVQVTSSEISATVNATTVRELPLNGRSWTDLAALQPGVSTIQTQPSFASGADRGNRGFGQQMTISGARPQQNNYRLDGISLNDYANGAPGSVLGGNLGVDAIQEFSVLTSNYSAEYGKTSGGVINAITRSGTNSFHGSLYEFLRNSALDARNFFEDPTAAKSPFKKNQFGGAIGGPIVKNRTFFFADFEGIRQSKGIAMPLKVPSVAARAGTIHYDPTPGAGGPPPGCTVTVPGTCTVTVNPTIQKYLALYPTSSACVAGQDVCPFTFSGQQVVTENFLTTRIDHKFSEKDGLAGTYLYDKTPYNSPDSFGNVGLNTLSARQIVAIEENHTFTPTFLNAVRFGYNHESVDNDASVKAINPAASDPSLGAFAGRDAAVVLVNGVLSGLPGGVGGLPTYLYRWNSFQVYDDAFINHGTHSIKFGVAVERMNLQVTALTDPNGIWNFSDLSSFLQANASKFQGGIASTLTPRNLRQSIIGGYVQDDWRWKPNLTLNLGLRYEMTTVPTETSGKIANLRNITDALPVCAVAHAGCSGTGAFFANPTLHNFEPRIGFAWDPRRNGKMAVRGGIGLFDVLPLPYQFILLTTQSAPFFQYTQLSSSATNPNCPAGTTINSTFPVVQTCLISANKSRSTYVESNPKRNYVVQWNLNVQYQLTSSLSSLVAYVGSRGVHQPFRVDEANLALPTKTTAGYLWPANDTILNPNYGSIRGMFYEGHSYYDALELQLAKHMSHGFQMQGTYTWGKSIDTSSATLAGDSFGNSISSLNYFDLSLTRGPSDFNVGRTLVVNGTWEVPTPKSFSGPARWLADGWELGLIFTASDGVPFTPTWGIGGDPANTLSGDDFAFPNRLKGPGCNTATNPGNPSNYIKTDCFGIPTAPNAAFWNANCLQTVGNANSTNLQCFNLRGNSGRNVLKGPGVTDLDFSVFKNNRVKRISETFNVQFRVEMFNILNHPNFAPPGPGDGNTDIFDPNGKTLSPVFNAVTNPNPGLAGSLMRTTVPERQIQFAVKVVF